MHVCVHELVYEHMHVCVCVCTSLCAWHAKLLQQRVLRV